MPAGSCGVMQLLLYVWSDPSKAEWALQREFIYMKEELQWEEARPPAPSPTPKLGSDLMDTFNKRGKEMEVLTCSFLWLWAERRREDRLVELSRAPSGI